MPAERYYIPDQLALGSELHLMDQEFHHIVNVMRTKEGEQVEIVNGKGVLAIAQVARIEKKRALLIVKERSVEPPSAFEIVLAQATPRMNRLDFILEKGTELGMTQLWLFHAQHSERKELTDSQLERMRSVTISAMKQCGRLYLPEIIIKPPLAKWTKLDYPSFFGDLDPKAPASELALIGSQECKGICFFVGPESGFTDKEEAALRALGVVGVKLHKNILRTETAALVALSLITHKLC